MLVSSGHESSTSRSTFALDCLHVARLDDVARRVHDVQEVTVQVSDEEGEAAERVNQRELLGADEVVAVALEERVRLLLEDHDNVARLVDARLQETMINNE